MDQPMVSVCLLTYNHEIFVEDCLKSLINQTYENIEIIILDNNSKDKTREVIQRYLPFLYKKFSNVFYYKNSKNSGLVKACNFFVSKASGDYIKFVSGDDILMSEFLSSTIDFLEKNKQYIMCYTNMFYVNENDRYETSLPKHNNIVRKKFRQPNQKEQFFRLLLQNYIFAPSALVRSEAYLKYGLYDENIGYEDYEFWLRMSQLESFGYLNLCLVGYRKTENSMSNYNSKSGRKKMLFMFTEDKKIINKYKIYLNIEEQKKCMESFYNRFFIFAVNELYYKFLIYLYNEMKKNNIKLSKENKNYFFHRIMKSLFSRVPWK